MQSVDIPHDCTQLSLFVLFRHFSEISGIAIANKKSSPGLLHPSAGGYLTITYCTHVPTFLKYGFRLLNPDPFVQAFKGVIFVICYSRINSRCWYSWNLTTIGLILPLGFPSLWARSILISTLMPKCSATNCFTSNSQFSFSVSLIPWKSKFSRMLLNSRSFVFFLEGLIFRF